MSDAAAVLYLRVSSAEQVAGTSLATQERDCRACAARMGLAVRGVYRDEGRSAKSVVGRDGLAAAVAECKRTGAALLVWKFDRLARNTRDALTVRDALLARGCRIVSATEGDATDGPMAKAMFGIASVIAELDNTIRAERARRGMVARAREGFWTSGPPAGFRSAKDAQGRPVLAPDERTAPAVRAAFAGLADGSLSTAEAVRAVMDGAGVSRATAFAVFRNPVYRGAIVSALTDGEEVPAAFPGLVSPEVWRAAFARFDHRTEGKVKMKENPTTPLVGVLVCAECGRALVGGLSRSHTGALHGYYRCRTPGHPSIAFRDAERAVRAMLGRLGERRDFLALVRANLERLTEIGLEGEAAKVEAARASLVRNEARLKRARAAFVDGLFDRDEYAEAKREAEGGIRDARIVLDTHERGTRRRGELVDALLDVAANPDAVLRLPPRPLRDALRAVFGPLRVTAAKTIEPDSASVYAALCGADGGESNLVLLLAGMLNPDGLVAAARLLRA